MNWSTVGAVTVLVTVQKHEKLDSIGTLHIQRNTISNTERLDSFQAIIAVLIVLHAFGYTITLWVVSSWS